MLDRETQLRTLSVGDIFGAITPNGARPFCQVIDVTETVIHAWSLTTQLPLDFDRRSGVAHFDNATMDWGNDIVPYTINSVAPLPPDIRDILLDLDRKHRSQLGDDELRLSKDEQRAMLFTIEYYDSNPI